MSARQRFVVTGTTGQIGPALARLTTQDHEVVVFSRNPARTRGAMPGVADYVARDPQRRVVPVLDP